MYTVYTYKCMVLANPRYFQQESFHAQDTWCVYTMQTDPSYNC